MYYYTVVVEFWGGYDGYLGCDLIYVIADDEIDAYKKAADQLVGKVGDGVEVDICDIRFSTVLPDKPVHLL